VAGFSDAADRVPRIFALELSHATWVERGRGSVAALFQDRATLRHLCRDLCCVAIARSFSDRFLAVAGSLA
jgi:hypothetical protein